MNKNTKKKILSPIEDIEKLVSQRHPIENIGQLEDIEKLVASRHSMNVDEATTESLTLGEKLSDKLADFAGSWTFLIVFGFLILGWISVNTVILLLKPFDPYPFILLNLILSCVAAVQAPIIMMSQNRQEKKDRIRAQHDYEINLKSEILIEEIIKRLTTIERDQKELLDKRK